MSYPVGAFVGTLVGLVFVLSVIAFSIWVIVDVIRTPREAFSSAGSSKALWLTLLLVFAVLAFFVTAVLGAVYLVGVRSRVKAMMDTADVSNNSASDPPANEEDVFPIEIRVALPRTAWTKVVSFSSETEKSGVEGSRWPSVIAVNRLGLERRLLECETTKEATAQAERVRADLEDVGARTWCEKYDVPWSFVTA